MSLQKKAEELFAGAKCEYSALCQELESDKPLFSINPGVVFSSASIIKVPILAALMEQARLGALCLDHEVGVEDILGDTLVFDYGPRKASLRELAAWATINSDNTSTNALIDVLGFEAVNAHMKAIGLKHTALRRKMLDFASRQAGIDNETSAPDMFLLFKHLFEAKSPEHAEAIEILRQQRSKKNLTRYIWEKTTIAHKTGGLDHLSHDAGVFSFGGRNVFVGVFLWCTEGVDGDPRLIGQLGRLVFDHFV